MQVHRKLAVAAAGVGVLVAGAQAGDLVEAVWDQPDLDRWMYPFNVTPGVKTTAPIFGANFMEGFDDLDAQYVIAWHTDDAILPGLGTANYQVLSVRVVVTTATADQFVYDPTFDELATYLDDDDPDHVPDADPGRPAMLYGAAFRNGYDELSFQETSPFGGACAVDPAQGCRNVFAAIFDDEGQPTDVSNMLKEGLANVPMAIGQTDAVEAGQTVPLNADMTFDVNLCEPTARAYFERALDLGVVYVALGSLYPATGGPDGGKGEQAYPVFYTKENLLAQPPFYHMARLEIVANVGDLADFNNDGVKNIFDFLAFQAAVIEGDPRADINGDCVINIFDFLAFQGLFTG